MYALRSAALTPGVATRFTPIQPSPQANTGPASTPPPVRRGVVGEAHRGQRPRLPGRCRARAADDEDLASVPDDIRTVARLGERGDASPHVRRGVVRGGAGEACGPALAVGIEVA